MNIRKYYIDIKVEVLLSLIQTKQHLLEVNVTKFNNNIPRPIFSWCCYRHNTILPEQIVNSVMFKFHTTVQLLIEVDCLLTLIGHFLPKRFILILKICQYTIKRYFVYMACCTGVDINVLFYYAYIFKFSVGNYIF